MRLDSFIIGFLVFSVIVLTGVFMIANLNDNYSLDMSTDEYSNTYDTINETYNLGQDMKGHTLEGELDDEEPWESSVKGGYSAIRLSKNTFELSGNILNDTSTQIGIPEYFKKAALTGILISVIFAIIYLFMRYNPL